MVVLVAGGSLAVWGGSVWASSSRSVRDVEMVRLVSPRQVLVVASRPAAPGVISSQRLLLGAGAVGRFRVIGPRLPADTGIDDVFFFDRRRGWISTWSLPHDSVTVYRTRDGGHHWSKAPAGGHSENAGAVSTLQFLSPRRGWMVTQEPTAPGATLAATTDGGRSWRVVDPSLPTVAPVSFRTPRDAWQAGNGLFHSTDGGRTWKRVRGPPVAGATVVYGSPAFHGPAILQPVTRLGHARTRLVVYRSVDGGRKWSVAGRLDVGGSLRSSCVFDDLASPFALALGGSAWWVGYYRSGRWHVDRSRDSGHSWARHVVSSRHAPDLCGHSPATLQALDSDTAWLSFTAGPNDGRLYATGDGGSRWRRVVP
jgi:photosystem II stability/assembly factor-like uncharacterized protein